MDGKVITDLLEPVIGKLGQVRLALQGRGDGSNDEKHPLLSRGSADGLVETSHADGWNVFDPVGVLAVEWMAKEGEGGGLYL